MPDGENVMSPISYLFWIIIQIERRQRVFNFYLQIYLNIWGKVAWYAPKLNISVI